MFPHGNKNIRIDNYLKYKWTKCLNHRLAECILKQDPYICCLQETHFRPRDTYRLKVRGWKKVFHANGNQKKFGVAILISDKIDFRIRLLHETKKDTT